MADTWFRMVAAAREAHKETVRACALYWQHVKHEGVEHEINRDVIRPALEQARTGLARVIAAGEVKEVLEIGTGESARDWPALVGKKDPDIAQIDPTGEG